MNYILCILCATCICIAFANGQSMLFPENEETTNGTESSGNRSGKNLFNWLGSFADEGADPYLSMANGACLQGDMTECFKARALSGLDEFFVKDSYRLNDNVRVIRMAPDDSEYRSNRAFEFSSEQRVEDSEWDKLVKFAMRKVEKFLRSTAVEVNVPDELTEGGRYSPRFIDEISSELDTIEDKKGSYISKKKVKKLLVPLLIVLKLFKLKLLLFLPLILGLASFKKFLGFMALVVPGLIGFFKLCKPDLQHNYGTFGHSSFYKRPSNSGPPSGPIYTPYREQEPPQYLQEEAYGQPYNRPARAQESVDPNSFRPSSSVAFREEAHDQAYSAYKRQQ
ncbi:uncharacterized protein LOC126901326 [Daktulosphaira vitifoliae]|uniref:uncharacterized protein LOC126901326 n=1 Tax=Daktulosphaira vitifoliae TaxID=58002 RepID=UPI0021AAFF59|nr:uncharacterized protein LOC126901326 [Daktulosphaira vitifoliae]